MTKQMSVRLDTPRGGFSTLHIGKYKIGIAITDEDGEQSPEEAGKALENMVAVYNEDQHEKSFNEEF